MAVVRGCSISATEPLTADDFLRLAPREFGIPILMGSASSDIMELDLVLVLGGCGVIPDSLFWSLREDLLLWEEMDPRRSDGFLKVSSL